MVSQDTVVVEATPPPQVEPSPPSGRAAPRAGWRGAAGRGAWLGFLWLSLCATGAGALLVHSSEPGEAPAPPAVWPTDSAVPRAPGRPTLVMVLHPRCPCSRASVAELARLMTRISGRAAVRALVVRPRGAPEGWETGDTWDSVAAIPGVTVIADVGGVEAARFQATTSGTTLLFDAAGALRFSGGITPARGHAGDSAGQDAIEAIVDEPARVVATPVYGCPLTEPAPGPGALQRGAASSASLDRGSATP